VRITVFVVMGITILRFLTTYKTVSVGSYNDQMAPTLEPSHRMLIHRGMVEASDFSPGEMVVYAVSDADGVSVRFGRVVAVPGDTVQVTNETGREVLVNGEPTAYAPELVSPAEAVDKNIAKKHDPVVVPEGSLFLVNDNLYSDLADSRTLGPIPEQAYAGKIVMSLNW
jgi:signal peptidase I